MCVHLKNSTFQPNVARGTFDPGGFLILMLPRVFWPSGAEGSSHETLCNIKIKNPPAPDPGGFLILMLPRVSRLESSATEGLKTLGNIKIKNPPGSNVPLATFGWKVLFFRCTHIAKNQFLGVLLATWFWDLFALREEH